MKPSLSIRSFISSLIMVGLIIILPGCGGGGSSAPVVDAKPAGYYTGSADVKTPSDNATNFNIPDLQIMINGTRIMMMSDSKVVVYDGQFTVSGNDLTSTVSIYYNGERPTGAAATATLKATITEGSQLTGTFTGTELGNGTFTSTFSTVNDTDSTVAAIDNVTPNVKQWQCSINEGVAFISLDIDNASTAVTAGNTSQSIFRNCDVEGTITPISSTPFYLVTINTLNNNCNTTAVESANSGVYKGFAVSKSLANDTLALTMSNGTYSTGDDCLLQ